MTPPNLSSWEIVLKFVEDITPWAMIFALLWKGIDKVFKYFSDARDAELRRIVHDEMNPHIENLTDKIEDLGKAIWALKQVK